MPPFFKPLVLPIYRQELFNNLKYSKELSMLILLYIVISTVKCDALGDGTLFQLYFDFVKYIHIFIYTYVKSLFYRMQVTYIITYNG